TPSLDGLRRRFQRVFPSCLCHLFLSHKTTGRTRSSVLLSDRLPAVMGERAVRLGHAVLVLSLLHGGTGALKGIEELGRELVRHTFTFSVARNAYHPAYCE